MPPWELQLPLDATTAIPLHRRVADAIRQAIRQGRLRPGERLPGSRSLAETLGIHRNTVLAAYEDLLAQGWLMTKQASGTYVAPELPSIRPESFAPSVLPAAPMKAPGFALAAPKPVLRADPEIEGVLSLTHSEPDLRLVPHELLGRAYRRALRLHGARLLGYGDPQGHERLREVLVGMLAARRGLAVSTDGLLISRGSQQGLDLCARVLLRQGDRIAVEALGYRPAWETFRHQGATLVAVDVDAQGICVEQFASLLPLRAIYVTPHHQYPTTCTLSAARRLQLLAFARQHRIAVIEDDYDHEFHYEGRPVMPLASADTAGVVIYLGTLSKILAPSLRLGFVAAPTAVIEAMSQMRRMSDRQGDPVLEWAIADLVQDGELQRHAEKMRRTYRLRRDALVTALDRHLGDDCTYHLPPGGMALWVRFAPDIDMARWQERCLDQGVSFLPGSHFRLDEQPLSATRLGFARFTPEELDTAVRRLAAARPTRLS